MQTNITGSKNNIYNAADTLSIERLYKKVINCLKSPGINYVIPEIRFCASACQFTIRTFLCSKYQFVE